jgi:hypothetical protein
MIAVFKELIEKYPCWNDMRVYLESEYFRISDEKNELCIIRYDKEISNMDLPYSRWFRSVVWNMRTHRPVCVAPPRASTDVPEGDVICQEMLDGFMINCFKTDEIYITSRSKLDASGTFYSNKSFRELFLECETIPITENTFYSFLVQHTEHRIVTTIEKNRVFVVHRGTVLEDGSVTIEDNPLGHIKTIELDANNNIQHIMLERSWEFQGVVLKDALGNRFRIRSNRYMVVKELRGNTSNISDRFCKLYSQNTLHRYIKFYPEEWSQMNAHLLIINIIIKMIYDNYVELHITKIVNVEDVNKMFLPHIYNLHGMFLNHRKKITIHDVGIYLQKLPWQRVAFMVKKCIGVIDVNQA